MPGKREEYATWDEFFMGLALLATTRSKDPRTQVGACIVNEEKHKVISIGYNGLTKGMNDDDFHWDSEGEITGDKTKVKDPYIVHAERNAIYSYGGSIREFEGSTMYVTFFPCSECAKTIAQVGIKKVIYRRMYSNEESNRVAKEIFENAGIIYEAYSEDVQNVTKETYQAETSEVLKMVKKYGKPKSNQQSS